MTCGAEGRVGARHPAHAPPVSLKHSCTTQHPQSPAKDMHTLVRHTHIGGYKPKSEPPSTRTMRNPSPPACGPSSTGCSTGAAAGINHPSLPCPEQETKGLGRHFRPNCQTPVQVPGRSGWTPSPQLTPPPRGGPPSSSAPQPQLPPQVLKDSNSNPSSRNFLQIKFHLLCQMQLKLGEKAKI